MGGGGRGGVEYADKVRQGDWQEALAPSICDTRPLGTPIPGAKRARRVEEEEEEDGERARKR